MEETNGTSSVTLHFRTVKLTASVVGAYLGTFIQLRTHLYMYIRLSRDVRKSQCYSLCNWFAVL